MLCPQQQAEGSSPTCGSLLCFILSLSLCFLQVLVVWELIINHLQSPTHLCDSFICCKGLCRYSMWISAKSKFVSSHSLFSAGYQTVVMSIMSPKNQRCTYTAPHNKYFYGVMLVNTDVCYILQRAESEWSHLFCGSFHHSTGSGLWICHWCWMLNPHYDFSDVWNQFVLSSVNMFLSVHVCIWYFMKK